MIIGVILNIVFMVLGASMVEEKRSNFMAQIIWSTVGF